MIPPPPPPTSVMNDSPLIKFTRVMNGSPLTCALNGSPLLRRTTPESMSTSQFSIQTFLLNHTLSNHLPRPLLKLHPLILLTSLMLHGRGH